MAFAGHWENDERKNWAEGSALSGLRNKLDSSTITMEERWRSQDRCVTLTTWCLQFHMSGKLSRRARRVVGANSKNLAMNAWFYPPWKASASRQSFWELFPWRYPRRVLLMNEKRPPPVMPKSAHQIKRPHRQKRRLSAESCPLRSRICTVPSTQIRPLADQRWWVTVQTKLGGTRRSGQRWMTIAS